MSEEKLVVLYSHEACGDVGSKLLTNVCTSTSTLLLAEEAVRGYLKTNPRTLLGQACVRINMQPMQNRENRCVITTSRIIHCICSQSTGHHEIYCMDTDNV